MEEKLEKFETFEIDDSFDPLEDLDPEMPAGEVNDYQVPLPIDEDKLPVREPVAAHADPQRTAEERIDALAKGMPGQKDRLVFIIEACDEPRTVAEIDERYRAFCPHETSVFSTERVMHLLEEAAALAGEDMAEEEEETVVIGADNLAQEEADEYLEVTPPPVRVYRATADGRAFVERNRIDDDVILDFLQEEESTRYLPIYRRMLEMAQSEEGCRMQHFDEAVDHDPLCVEPRRFAGWFLAHLERIGALRFNGSWHITDEGRRALASDIFAFEGEE